MQPRTITRETRRHPDAMGQGRVHVTGVPVTVRSALRFRTRKQRMADMSIFVSLAAAIFMIWLIS